MRYIRVHADGEVLDEGSPNSNTKGQVVQETKYGRPWAKFLKPHPVETFNDTTGHTLTVHYKGRTYHADRLGHKGYASARIAVFAVMRRVLHNNGWRQYGVVEIASFNPRERPSINERT